MQAQENDITILAIGDRADYDSFKKFNKEKNVFIRQGFDYVSSNYRSFLKGRPPRIKTRKVLIFLFFPFQYWNENIEYKGYKGIYGNHTFFKKFLCLWQNVNEAIKRSLADKEIFFVNQPNLCGLYRDKVVVKNRLSQAKIPNPKMHHSRRLSYIKKLINKGNNLFLKSRYGSMGKGITYLNFYSWHTNFIFKHNKIYSRRSDRGWKFKDITGKSEFLRKLLRKDIIIEDAVNPLVVKGKMIDLRMYVFFNKVVYVYPRKNKPDKITTNISQGARGDPMLLEKLPRKLLARARYLAEKVSKSLNLNFLGMDIMIDRNLKDIYCIDVNVFPGFPKRKTFNLSQAMIEGLAHLSRNGVLHFK